MRLLVVLVAIAAVTLADDLEHSQDLKKRGVPKTSPINSIPGNGHQKPETLNYQNYQQSTATQTPLYPLAPTTYQQQESHQQQAQQYNYPQAYNNYQQPILPFHFVQQPLMAQPKYQLVAMKNANGQTQLTLIPQGFVMNQLGFNQAGLYSLQQPLVSNHAHTNLAQSATIPTPHQHGGQNNYVTPQPLTYTTSPVNNAQLPLAPPHASYYSHPSYNQNPVVAQPSTMYLYSQPEPHLYNNYLNSQSNLLYTPAGQQLLNYYQSNPQAKYQLLYGNNAQQQQGQYNSYQTPLSGTEYEKSVSSPVQQSLSNPKSDSDLSLNTNEYIAPADTHFRPISSYRGPGSYKDQ